MYFQAHFERRVGATPAAMSALGSSTDPEPDADTRAKDGKDNVFQAKVAGVGNTIQRLVVGYHYAGVGPADDLEAKAWVYDRRSERWYLAGTVTLEVGELRYIRVPYLCDPPQTNANLSRPTSGGAEYMVTIADPGGLTDGVYTFVMGADTAQF